MINMIMFSYISPYLSVCLSDWRMNLFITQNESDDQCYSSLSRHIAGGGNSPSEIQNSPGNLAA